MLEAILDQYRLPYGGDHGVCQTRPTKVFDFAGFSLLRLLLNRCCENRSASKGLEPLRCIVQRMQYLVREENKPIKALISALEREA